MKFPLIYTFFALLTLGFFLVSNSSGPGAVQGQDRTGSPLSNGACQICHASGAFAPTITAELLEDGEPVSEYEAGKTYTLRVEVSPTEGSPTRYGFQAVALTGADDVNAGAFGTPGAGIQVTTLQDRDYAEHSVPNTANGAFEIEWTAPEAGTGDVRIYAAGVAANGANGSGGDGGVFLVNPVVLSELLSDTREALAGNATFDLLRNPVGEQLDLRLQTETAARYELRLFDLNGRLLQARNLDLLPGRQNLAVDMGAAPAGLYLVSLTDGRAVVTQRVLKR